MGYNAIRTRYKSQPTEVTTFGSPAGLNLRITPQLLNPANALIMTNYLCEDSGKLKKRAGITSIFTVAGTVGITMLEKYDSTHWIYGYGTKLAVYDTAAVASTVIKTYSVTGNFSGNTYGNYFFCTNGTVAIDRISRELDYDAQSANFAVGLTLTGGTSGATGVILEDSDGGATGTLTLGDVTGTFQTNETITDSATGSATSNGTLDWTATSIAAAPVCNVVRAIGSRLYAGALLSDRTAVKYSKEDDGTNPPFTNWTVATTSTAAGLLNFRRGGEVKEISSLGNVIVVLSEEGKWAFSITTIDSSGTLTKIDTSLLSRQDNGGERGAIVTDKGMFYVNESGLWQLVSLGQDNVPFSDQEGEASILLGDKFFDDIVFTDADLVYDRRRDNIYITCRQDSSVNNLVIAYNLTNKAFSMFTGLNINRFMTDGADIYASSGTGSTDVWKFLDGTDDDGAQIFTEYYQELRLGNLETRQVLLGQYVQGELSPSSVIDIRFDIYDREGTFIPDKLKLQWGASGTTGSARGYGDGGWGTLAWGGDVDTAGTSESFAGGRERIANFQRVLLRLTSQDQSDHTINWIKLEAQVKAQIRRRNLTNIT